MPPGDLAKWCIRFELSREEMLINSMEMRTIINAFIKKFPDMYCVHTSENVKSMVLRCYVRYNMIKISAGHTTESAMMDIVADIRNTIIRGVFGIKNATVVSVTEPFIKEDGSIENESVYGIETLGSNLEAVTKIPEVDTSRTVCDSIMEYKDMYGLAAARDRIIREMIKTMDVLDKTHATLYADEMCFSGEITSLHKSGMQAREMSNVPLRLGFQSPVQVAESAAVNGYVSKVSGVSGPLIMGSPLQVGTQYNKVIVNTRFCESYSKKLAAKMDDEL